MAKPTNLQQVIVKGYHVVKRGRLWIMTEPLWRLWSLGLGEESGQAVEGMAFVGQRGTEDVKSWVVPA